MRLTNLVSDRDAVSPVIGVILMVAITVILSAVIGAFVLGIDNRAAQPPQPTWDVEEDKTTVAGSSAVSSVTLEITGVGNRHPDTRNLRVTAGGRANESFAGTSSKKTLAVGDEIRVDFDGGGGPVADGSPVRIVWADRGTEQILVEHPLGAETTNQLGTVRVNP